MSGRSVWAFEMASRRRTIVNTHTDLTRILYRTCEYTLFQNGGHFSVLLFGCKLALVASFVSSNFPLN